MEVFISWSGEKSKALAAILKDWFPAVIQAVKPYFTPEDLLKGTKWNTEISKKLDACQLGIICLTSDNYNAPWILFEAGALSKHVDISHVCPVLFNLEAADISGPLVNFQFTLFNKDDIKRLVKMINSMLENDGMAESILENVFEVWWPKLDELVRNELSKKEKNAQKAITRPDRDLLEELLSLTRENSRGSTATIMPTEVLDDLIQNYRIISDYVQDHEIDALKNPLARLYRPIRYISYRYSSDSVVNNQIIHGTDFGLTGDFSPKSNAKNLLQRKQLVEGFRRKKDVKEQENKGEQLDST